MKYLRSFNESNDKEKDWDLEEISDIFQDFIDEGFELDDIKVGSSLSIYPNTWCVSHHLDIKENKTIKSLTIKFNSKQYHNYDLSILDILNKSINHFKSIYTFKLDSILVNVNLPFLLYHSKILAVQKKLVYRYSYFNSCETIKDLFTIKDIEVLPKNIEFTLTFDLT